MSKAAQLLASEHLKFGPLIQPVGFTDGTDIDVLNRTMKLLSLALLLLLPGSSVAAQTDLPTYGRIDRIKTFTKVYVASDNDDSRERVIKALGKNKSLQVVNSPDEAEFFIEYGELSREAVVTGVFTNETKERQQRNQMRVFIFGADKRRIIVWSETGSRETEHFLGMKMYDSGRSESELTSKFLKALKKVKNSN